MTRKKTIENPELSLRDKLVYGAACFGDAATYVLTSTFLLFYLTTVAGIPPVLAGTIIAIGSIWDAVMSPVFGYLSDNCHSSMGRRRPFLLIGSIPLTACTMLLFTTFSAGIAFKAVYYIAIIIIYWTVFSCFFVPYMAFGAELTHNYDERTILRSFSTVFNTLGAVVGAVCPTIIVDLLCSGGLTVALSWQMTALIIGGLAGGAVLICFAGFKGRDIPLPRKKGQEKGRFSIKTMARDYVDVLRIKPLQMLIGASITCLIGITIFNADRIYFLTYNLEFSAKQISLVLLISNLFGFIIPFFINMMTRWFDKRHSFLILAGGGALVCAAFRWIGVTGWISLILLIGFYAFCNTAYWHLMPTLLYDVGEYDEYHSGDNRIGRIMSLLSLAEAAAEAIGIQLLGVILQFAGFHGEAAIQGAVTMDWIANCLMIVPAIFIGVSCLFIYRYPITREVFQKIQQKLEARKKEMGEEKISS